jgi:hypothetical protein
MIGTLLVLAMTVFAIGAEPKQEKKPQKQPANSEQPSKPGERKRDDDCHCHSYESSVCPNQPIAVYEGGTLYDASYFDPDCDAEPQATYMFGDIDWPWHVCPDDCRPPVRGATDFQGLPEPVGLDYMHTRPSARSGNESCFPGGPARRCCRVNPTLNNLFLEFTDGTTTRHAKVLQLEINNEMALYLPDKDHWTTHYVAFENSDMPSSVNEVITINAQPVIPPNDHIRRARIRVGIGRMAEVLILLKK